MKNRSFRKTILLALVIAAGLLLLTSAALAEHSGSSGYTSWTLDDSGKLTISGSGKMDKDAISGWREYASEIKTVVISEGITDIGLVAFQECENLTEITVPASVASIVEGEYDGLPFFYSPQLAAINVDSGNQKFASVNGVLFNKSKSKLIFHPPGRTATSYSIPSSVTVIGDGAFFRSEKLKSVTIPSGVTDIGDSAFMGCSSLTGAVIPSGVTHLGGGAFDSCYSMASVTIPNSITRIPDYAFQYCENLRSISIPGGVTSIGDCAFLGCEALTSLTIPSSVTSIGDWAFSSCTGLTSISIPGSVTSIGEGFLYYCPGLANAKGFVQFRNVLYGYFGQDSKVVIPNTVTVIAPDAFRMCTGVTGVTIPSGVTSIGDRAFYNCTGLTGITIPNGVTRIGIRAFENCSALASVTIPNSVTTIDSRAFAVCEKLASVTVPGSVTQIGDSAFTCCYALSSLRIEEGVTDISGYAFYMCTSLTSARIPGSVTSIGMSAFGSCGKLASVTVYNQNAGIDRWAFENCASGLILYGWPSSTAKDYASAYGITFRALEVPDPDFFLPASLTAIPQNAFTGIKAKAVVIPKKVTSISANPFATGAVLAVYGYAGSAAETFANKYGYYFITVDDAWMANHGE